MPSGLLVTDVDIVRNELLSWLSKTPRPSGLHDYGATPNPGDVAAGRAWQLQLADAGWACISWPHEYGGRDASALEQAIFAEEMAKAGVPRQLNIVGPDLVGPMLIAHGTDEQKARHLSAIRMGSVMWCQLFSEPGAGSDLAHVRTSATATSDGWLISGQKVWTSGANSADMGLLLASTVGDSPSLCMFLVPMNSGGIDVRPLRQIDGDSKFNEVFFDEVLLPHDSLLGEVGQGWTIAMGTLGRERLALGSQAVALRVILERIVSEGTERGRRSPLFLDQAIRLWCRTWLLRTTWLRGVSGDAGSPNAALSVLKLVASELQRDVTRFAGDALGCHLIAGTSESPLASLMLAAPGQTIAGGTSEIQRNILAERMLGLPRH